MRRDDLQKAMNEAHVSLGIIKTQFGALATKHGSDPNIEPARRLALARNTYDASVRLANAMLIAGEIVVPDKRDASYADATAWQALVRMAKISPQLPIADFVKIIEGKR
jgi:hypothetical protein